MAEREEQKERAATLRAGLVASTILNVNRTKRSQKVWQPSDFVRDEPRERVKQLTPEQAKNVMDRWALGVNQRADI